MNYCFEHVKKKEIKLKNIYVNPTRPSKGKKGPQRASPGLQHSCLHSQEAMLPKNFQNSHETHVQNTVWLFIIQFAHKVYFKTEINFKNI